MRHVTIDALKGKVLTSIEGIHSDDLRFHTTDGQTYRMYHSQNCCERVDLAEVIGSLDDLIGSPITEAEVVESQEEDPPKADYAPDSFTWTFYKLGTIKGHVTLRWYGESNGYYSERVDFELMRH